MFTLKIYFRIFGGAIGVSSFLNLFIPGACQVSPGFVVFVRVLQGLVEVSVINTLYGRVNENQTFGRTTEQLVWNTVNATSTPGTLGENCV